MKIEVSVTKGKFFGIIFVILVSVALIGVYAYNSSGNGGNPAVFGHSADELEITMPNGTVTTLQNAIYSNVIVNNITQFTNQVSNQITSEVINNIQNTNLFGDRLVYVKSVTTGGFGCTSDFCSFLINPVPTDFDYVIIEANPRSGENLYIYLDLTNKKTSGELTMWSGSPDYSTIWNNKTVKHASSGPSYQTCLFPAGYGPLEGDGGGADCDTPGSWTGNPSVQITYNPSNPSLSIGTPMSPKSGGFSGNMGMIFKFYKRA